MKVKIHKLFDYLLETTSVAPEAFVGFSLSQPPKLKEFLSDLDPEMSLDWNGRDFRGLPELRAHVLREAGLMEVLGIEDVLITAGAAEANYLAIMQLVQPGDRLVIERPGWPQVEVLGRAIGAEIVEVVRHEADGWALPLDDLDKAVVPGTRMIFLTNPNNPTGRLMQPDELNEIVRIARRAGAWLVVDEVYAGLEWQDRRIPSVAGLYERGITVGSVSKALGLQGLRTGWLICRDRDMVMDAVILRENSSEIMNIMGEVIAEIAMRPDRYRSAIDQARADGRANLDQLHAFVEGQPNLSWVRPEAGLIGLARLPDGLDSDTFAKRLRASPYHTFLLPGSAYHQPNHIRIGVGGGIDAALELGLTRLGMALAEYAKL